MIITHYIIDEMNSKGQRMHFVYKSCRNGPCSFASVTEVSGFRDFLIRSHGVRVSKTTNLKKICDDINEKYEENNR